MTRIDPKDWTTWGKPSKRKPCPCGSGKTYRECCRAARKASMRRGRGAVTPSKTVKHLDGVTRPDGIAGDTVDKARRMHDTLCEAEKKRWAACKVVTTRALKEIEEQVAKGLRASDHRDQSERLYRICSIYEGAMRELVGGALGTIYTPKEPEEEEEEK
jgi:hypothetical protein